MLLFAILILCWAYLNMHEREILHENMSLKPAATTITTTITISNNIYDKVPFGDLIPGPRSHKCWVFRLMTFAIEAGEFSCGICHVSVRLKCEENIFMVAQQQQQQLQQQ